MVLLQKCLRLDPDLPVWVSKQRVLVTLTQSLSDVLNYGLFQPAFNGRAGKFLDEERLLKDYPLPPITPIPYLEVTYPYTSYPTQRYPYPYTLPRGCTTTAATITTSATTTVYYTTNTINTTTSTTYILLRLLLHYYYSPAYPSHSQGFSFIWAFVGYVCFSLLLVILLVVLLVLI